MYGDNSLPREQSQNADHENADHHAEDYQLYVGRSPAFYRTEKCYTCSSQGV